MALLEEIATREHQLRTLKNFLGMCGEKVPTFLIEEPSRPGKTVCEIRYTLRQVFEWLQMMPEQIELTVIKFASNACVIFRAS
jgi:hypothetical protein